MYKRYLFSIHTINRKPDGFVIHILTQIQNQSSSRKAGNKQCIQTNNSK